LQVLAVARATAALCASINTVSDARSDAPEYFADSDGSPGAESGRSIVPNGRCAVLERHLIRSGT